MFRIGKIYTLRNHLGNLRMMKLTLKHQQKL
jgi:hypothetical protein